MTVAKAGLAYADPAYAGSLAGFGTPTPLSRSGGWLLERPVPDSLESDLCGPYPLFACMDWGGLNEDLAAIVGPVSLVLVPDPLTQPAPQVLARWFPDRFVAFKTHMVVELTRPRPLGQHHRRHVRRAARLVDVEICVQPSQYLSDWVRLYGGLVERDRLSGLSAFSEGAFALLFEMRGVLAVRAVIEGETVSMGIFLTTGTRAYYHLGASSARGYAAGASYVVFERALLHLQECGVEWVDLGGTAGHQDRNDGLLRYKRGWSNGERQSFLCGRILDHQRYAALEASARGSDRWFPSYRAPALAAAALS